MPRRRGRPPSQATLNRKATVLQASLRRALTTRFVSSKVPSLPGQLFPAVRKFNFVYHDFIGVSTTGPHIQTYRSNSLYDVDYTNSGLNAQPLGYDSFTELYNQYIVESATIIVEAFSRDTVNGTHLCVYPSLQPAPTCNTMLQFKAFSEQPGGRCVLLPRDGSTKRIKINCRIDAVIGATKEQLAHQTYGSTLLAGMSESPVRISYVTILGVSGDNLISTATNSFSYKVTLKLKSRLIQTVQDLTS